MYRGLGANTPEQTAAGLKNCGWWDMIGSPCYMASHPDEDGTLGCALGIASCFPLPPRLRSAGPPPPIDSAGMAPPNYTTDDAVDAARAQTAGVLSNWWAGLPGEPLKDEPIGGLLLAALVVGGVALFKTLKG